MKAKCAVVALLTCCAIEAAAVQGVNAQEKPPAFTIAEIEIIDPESFQTFSGLNAQGVAAAGGRFLVRRGRIVTSAGHAPKDVAMIAWDNLDQATAYFDSATFRGLIPLRDKGAKVRLFTVEGLPPK